MIVFLNSDVDIQAQLSMNQSRAEEITMREDYGSLTLPHHDEGFGDLDFNEDAPELLRDQPERSTFDDRFDDHENDVQRSDKEVMNDDGFGAPLGQDMMGETTNIIFSWCWNNEVYLRLLSWLLQCCFNTIFISTMQLEVCLRESTLMNPIYRIQHRLQQIMLSLES
jgi:hypothetical protein